MIKRRYADKEYEIKEVYGERDIESGWWKKTWRKRKFDIEKRSHQNTRVEFDIFSPPTV